MLGVGSLSISTAPFGKLSSGGPAQRCLLLWPRSCEMSQSFAAKTGLRSGASGGSGRHAHRVWCAVLAGVMPASVTHIGPVGIVLARLLRSTKPPGYWTFFFSRLSGTSVRGMRLLRSQRAWFGRELIWMAWMLQPQALLSHNNLFHGPSRL